MAKARGTTPWPGVRYREARPHPALRDSITCYGRLSADGEATSRIQGALVPDGHLELGFDLAAARYDHIDGFWVRRPRVVIDEVLPWARQIAWMGPIRYVSVKFSHGSGLALLGLAATDVATDPIDGSGVAALSGLYERLAARHDWAEAVNTLDRFFLPRLCNLSIDPIVAAASSLVRSHAGTASVRTVAASLGVSTRTLQHRVRGRTGMTPKHLAQVIRVRAAIRKIGGDPRRSLAEHAAALGYCDQSHFIREFRRATGETPTDFFARPHFVSDLLPGA